MQFASLRLQPLDMENGLDMRAVHRLRLFQTCPESFLWKESYKPMGGGLGTEKIVIIKRQYLRMALVYVNPA